MPDVDVEIESTFFAEDFSVRHFVVEPPLGSGHSGANSRFLGRTAKTVAADERN